MSQSKISAWISSTKRIWKRAASVGMTLAIVALVSKPVMAWDTTSFCDVSGQENNFGPAACQIDGMTYFSGINKFHLGETSYLRWNTTAVTNIFNVNGLGYQEAIVHHTFLQNTNTNCGLDVQTFTSYGYSNLPGMYVWVKATNCSPNNEIRLRIGSPSSLVAGLNYYTQALYWDPTAYPSGPDNGEITVDTYLEFVPTGARQAAFSKFMGKFCYNSVGPAHATSSGNCY